MATVRSAVLAFAFVAILLPGSAHPAPLAVIGFNTESGGDTDPQKVAQDIRSIGTGVDLFGLSEVADDTAARLYAVAAGTAQGQGQQPYRALVSKTGGTDRTAILFNPRRLELIGNPAEYTGQILKACGTKPTHQFRAPFSAKFRDRLEPRLEFIFFVTHLQRGDEEYRHCQAKWLNGLARAYSIAMIATGDFNFDWSLKSDEQNQMKVGPGAVCRKAEFTGPKHDVGFDNMTVGGTWCWVMPPTLIKTQCAASYDGVLDFVFVANRAKSWARSSEILRREPGYCARDGQGWSDHRPVRGDFVVE